MVFPPSSPNPSHYPRSAEITDDECLSILVQLESLALQAGDLVRRISLLQEDLGVVAAQQQISKTMLFRSLRTAYPGIESDPSEVGWRKWQEKYYYVGWGGVPPQG